MKKLTIALLTAYFAMALPMIAAATQHMDHGEHGSAMDGEKMKHGEMEHGKEMSHDMHQGHDMHGGDDFVEVGKDTQDGVVATVKVKTYDEQAMATMAKMGMNATHHVMVYFTEEKDGAAVAGGMAAVKIKGSGDDAPKPVMLMLMGNGFGGDVTVKEMGMYTFEIGTKLEDGKKRQFEVPFHNM